MTMPLVHRQRRAAGIFLAPFLVLFTLVTIAPLGYSIWLSLFSEQTSGLGFGGVEQVFVGISNYVAALGDPAFRSGFGTIAAYIAIYVPLLMAAALLLALILDSGLAWGRKAAQLTLFLPHAVPGLIAALIWLYLYTPGLSPVIEWLGTTGPGGPATTNPLLSVVNIAVWQWLGYNIVIFYAALQSVPDEVVDAAVVDGARPWQVALMIKLPLIRPAVVMAALFTAIGGVQLFTEPKILDQASASITSTWTPNMFLQSVAFDRNDYGLAAAASIIVALVAGGLSFVVMRLGNRGEA
ncbi:MAG TPA: sugar ABC transporter permease [Phycicoccus sp.]|jgi:multiple sugar transport system permease protein|nr:sugar ABC transporter permease [Phycicoccus sp.]HQK30815.1 sugar ABC transporter permease [Phycicoccus sp.]HQV90540.1 sugar ABC transporter permease [Phycicoccus sp.]HQY95929.1 sugar ABC transporter permease [Phycicoccus sp.]HRA43944.1 sugar ABC transporter permease [Phycicoccus sp.]